MKKVINIHWALLSASKYLRIYIYVSWMLLSSHFTDMETEVQRVWLAQNHIEFKSEPGVKSQKSGYQYIFKQHCNDIQILTSQKEGQEGTFLLPCKVNK